MSGPPPGPMSLDAFVAWANKEYGLSLPKQADFTQGSTLYVIWGTTVQVTSDPDKGVLAKVEGTTDLTVFSTVKATKIYMELRDASADTAAA